MSESTPQNTQARVAVGNFEVIEVLHAVELEKLLRTVGPNLGECQVKTPSALEPWMVEVCGALMIYGAPHFWTTPIDMRGLKTAEDILQLAGAIETSFDKAAETVKAST